METSQGSLDEVVARLRSARTDFRSVEVKSAVQGLPTKLWRTVSSFSNQAGGLIILGLDEDNAFLPASGFDAPAIQDAVSEAFRPRGEKDSAGPLTPRPIGTVDIGIVDGSPVVIIEVEELPPAQKPCFVTAQGMAAGTYERVGDGNRRMSAYGVFLLTVDGHQPKDDAAPVTGATLADLDEAQVERFVARLRRTRPHAVADLTSVADLLRRFNVVADDGQTPTFAGLMALGRYPQQFFPQAMITFAAYPGGTKEMIVGETRMLDRRVLEGPIPVMVADCVRAVLQNTANRRIVTGVGGRDEPEIPVLAVREAVTNALTHRDYSHLALGQQVLVELFPDRLEVTNPGGIYGGRTVIDLFDGVSVSRNAILATLLAEVPQADSEEAVSENAGSGIPAMTGALGQAGLAAPKYDATVTRVTVALGRHGLLDPQVDQWLAEIGAAGLDVERRRALALVHLGFQVDDQVLRAHLAMDSNDARAVLRSLVEEGWLQYPRQSDGPYRPGARLESTLDPWASPRHGVDQVVEGSVDARIIEALGAGPSLNVHEITGEVDASLQVVRRRLQVLVAQGAVIATAPPQSRQRRYRLAGQGHEPQGSSDWCTCMW